MISWPVARAAAREKLRSPTAIAIGLCFVAVGALRAGPEGGSETFSNFGQAFFILLTLTLGAGLLSDELDSGHAQLVLLRPITRAAWLGGRLAGAGLAMALFVALAWCASAANAVHRGHGFALSRLAALPLALVWGYAWLCLLACLGTVLPGWTNAGALVVAGVAWLFVQVTLPLALGKPDLARQIAAVAGYLGPQDPMHLLQQPRMGIGALLYDLVWIFNAWLTGALLFNRRELARRRT